MVICNYQWQRRIGIVSLHLKATEESEALRKQQMKELFEFLSTQKEQVDEFVICGDFNLRTSKEDKWIHPAFTDTWAHLQGPEVNGCTFEPNSNVMILKCWPNGTGMNMRLDRILVKQSKCLIPASIARFGTDLMFKDDTTVIKGAKTEYERDKKKYLFASDHYGLVCKLNVVL